MEVRGKVERIAREGGSVAPNCWRRVCGIALACYSLSLGVGCGGKTNVPPPPTSPISTTPPPITAPSPRLSTSPPDNRGQRAAVTTETSAAEPSVTLWQPRHVSRLREWEQRSRQLKDRAEFEKTSRALREQYAEDRDALIDALELEARLWHEVFQDRTRQVETLQAVRHQFAQQAYDDAVEMGRQCLHTALCFSRAGRRRDQLALTGAFLQFPLNDEPFYENTPNRYFGQQPVHEHHAEVALKAVGACETPSELAELEIEHFAFGYIERLIPSYGEKLRNRGPTAGDRAFDKMKAEFFRCLITKIPQKHPAVDSALFIRRHK